MTPAVLDQVERALEGATRGHEITTASTSGYRDGFGTPTFYRHDCQCPLCKALSALRAARKEGEMGCDCISYNRPEPHQKTTETILETPKWARDGGAQDSICVDACIADAVKALWRAKIWTLGSCCGHNNPDLRGIIVEKGDRIAAMAILKGIDPSIKIGAWELIWTPSPHRQ